MKKKLSLLIFGFFMAASFTACEQGVCDNQLTIGGTSQTKAAIQTEVVYNAEITDSLEPEKVFGKELRYNADEHIELCSLEIKSGEQIYGIKVFIYDRIGETDNEARGDAAFELYKNGERVNTIAPIIGYIGQRGKTYVKNKPEDYFNVIKLDGGEVFAVTYPEDNGLSTTVFCTVRDEN